VFAIRALNVETSRVADLVQRGKDTPILQIRFQWWREAVSAALRGQPREHPVLLALAHIHQAAQLPRYHLSRLLDTREADQVLGQQPATLQELEQYADGTASQVWPQQPWQPWRARLGPCTDLAPVQLSRPAVACAHQHHRLPPATHACDR
jgi:hypothetical protein